MIKVKFNTTQFKKDLSDFVKHEQSSLEETTKEVAEQIAADTKYLDSDVPQIANSITTEKNADGNGWIVNKGGNMDIPIYAYSEFGTGDYAGALLSSYPQEWKDMARQYFVNGKGRIPAKPALYTSFNRNIKNIIEKAAQKING